jgi:dephospho-CoA kinase
MNKRKNFLVIGLTGGIGMGKSAVAKLLRGMGFPVYHADRAVHGLLRKGGKAVKPVARLFPEALRRGAIDRAVLGPIVFNRPAKLKKLERILHPLVREEEKIFLAKARKAKARAAILEIPLLFETKGEKRCDAVLCVTAPKAVQKARVLARPGMTEAKFRAIVSRQMPDKEKRAKADYVIDTGTDVAATRKQLRRAVKLVIGSSR